MSQAGFNLALWAQAAPGACGAAQTRGLNKGTCSNFAGTGTRICHCSLASLNATVLRVGGLTTLMLLKLLAVPGSESLAGCLSTAGCHATGPESVAIVQVASVAATPAGANCLCQGRSPGPEEPGLDNWPGSHSSLSG